MIAIDRVTASTGQARLKQRFEEEAVRFAEAEAEPMLLVHGQARDGTGRVAGEFVVGFDGLVNCFAGGIGRRGRLRGGFGIFGFSFRFWFVLGCYGNY